MELATSLKKNPISICSLVCINEANTETAGMPEPTAFISSLDVSERDFCGTVSLGGLLNFVIAGFYTVLDNTGFREARRSELLYEQLPSCPNVTFCDFLDQVRLTLFDAKAW